MEIVPVWMVMVVIMMMVVVCEAILTAVLVYVKFIVLVMYSDGDVRDGGGGQL